LTITVLIKILMVDPYCNCFEQSLIV